MDEKVAQIRDMFERAQSFMDEVMQENQRLRAQLGEVEAENREFADRYVQIEQHNEVLQNLYVTSHRLHATLDPQDVVQTIKEIIVNLVGAESFAIWMLDDDVGASRLQLLAHEGLDMNADLLPEERARSEKVLRDGAWYPESAAGAPTLAMIPLRVDDRSVGMIVIRKLLAHKKEISKLDREILDLLSGQAATALASARLYAEKSRKLETMKAFLDFVKTPR